MTASMNNDLCTRRALGTYLHSCGARANALLAMSGEDTDAKGRRYVVLRDGGIDICAVYRVGNDGTLTRLKRWPVEVG
ncbi:MAG: hypothetical protein U5L05_16470 [Rubrivivax sp.]|nr:hypothetical protein [Rubrivivax sp.]